MLGAHHERVLISSATKHALNDDNQDFLGAAESQHDDHPRKKLEPAGSDDHSSLERPTALQLEHVAPQNTST